MQLDIGRTNQKARTRRALLAAARRLLDRHEPASVATAADEAGISRATAYRYFSDADALTLEAILDGQFATPAEVVGETADVRERVHKVRRYLFRAVREAEIKFRLFLARALDSWVANRGPVSREIRAGRRLPMYEHALAPARPHMRERDLEFLVLSLSAASGLESYLALKDVCRVDDALADKIAASNIDAILDKLLPPAEKSAPSPRRGKAAKVGKSSDVKDRKR
jgi:AcrR family transcriptional regulator